MRLLRMFILRPLARNPLHTALTLLAVALGVAVVVGIELAGEAASGSFRSSLRTLVGTADLQILANGGMDEAWMGRLARLPVNARFSPVVESQARLAGAESITLYGLDFVANAAPEGRRLDPADRNGGLPPAVVSHRLAERLRLRTGDAVTVTAAGRSERVRVQAVAQAGPAEFLALDIADAQQLLDRFGKLDRIDVVLPEGADLEPVERAVRRLLPASFLLERPGVRSQENQRMLRAFRWNLRALSYISLVVGAFLIYNTIAVSVVRRRPEIGILRALGVDRGGVFRLFLLEALLFGAGGAALGLPLGRLMAEASVGLIAQTIQSLYTSSTPGRIAMGWPEAAAGILAGLAVALASAFAPAREATSVVPSEAMGRGSREHAVRVHWRRGLGIAAILSVCAWALSRARPWNGQPVGGYTAALLAIAAAAFCAPALVLAADRMTRAAVRRWLGAPGIVAGRSLAASLGRTSVMAAALATAVAMMASVAIMVGSFRETVEVWLDTQLRADLYLRPALRSGAGEYPPLAPDVAAVAAGVPGVAAVDDFHALEFRYDGDRVTLGAGNLAIVRRYGRLRFLPGENRDAILASLPGQDRAIVSEPFANRHGVRAGDRLMLALGPRTVPITVAGVYYEYSSTQGYIILDRSTLLRYLPGQPATNLAVYLRPESDAGAVKGELERRLAGRGVSVAPNAALRRNALAIFDRTFAITWALEAVAILVAMLGAANSLLALVLDRQREFGLLRYLGASAGQVRRMVLLEAGFLGLLGNLLGLALGFVLSLLLIFVVNKQSFGWTIQFHPPVGLLAGACALVWCVMVLAGLYPARIAARLNPIEVIHEE